MKILDDSGLAYFWGKIKAWCNAAFALIGHVHPSSDVTLMTGYSMPQSTSAIAATDTLNQAVGKLEKAISAADVSNVVHRTGDETIAGEKTFTGPYSRADTISGIIIRNLDVVRGTVPSDAIRYWHIVFLDATGTEYRSDGTHGRLGLLSVDIGTSSSNYKTKMQLAVYDNVAGSTENAQILLGIGTNGDKYFTAPSTSSSRTNGTDVLTRDWIPNDTRIVHTTGAEDISGAKTFYSGIVLDENRLTYRTANSVAGDNKDVFIAYDKDGHRRFILRYYPNGVTTGSDAGDTVHTSILSLTETSSSTLWGGNFTGGRDANGTPYCSCTATSASRTNATDIITRGFLAGSDSNVVHRTGDETVSGVKFFQSEIVEQINSTVSNDYRTWLQARDSNNETVFIFRTYPNGYGTNSAYTYIQALDHVGGTAVWGGRVVFGYDSTNSCAYVSCSETSSSRTDSSDVITRGFLAGSGSNVVHRTGDETIAGSKTFSSTIVAGSMCRSGTGSLFSLYGGTATANSGAQLNRNGATRSSSAGHFNLYAATSSSASVMLNGRPNGTLYWNGQTVQTSSDERLKTPLSAVPDAVLDAWGDVEWGQFQFLGAIAEKGGSARLHAGLIAQAVGRAFEARGLDACRYGILCHELREASEDDPGEDLWMVRYAEALCMEAAYQRRENARLKKRVSDLEDRLAALEFRLGSE